MPTENVILVDHNDTEIGIAEKMAAHKSGDLHRAFSVLIFSTSGEMLLQQRAHSKYHSPGLWTNACCSHPRPKEAVEAAAERRLIEEMGIRTSLQKSYSFIYHAVFGNGLIEHELDHVFVGFHDHDVVCNDEEVANFRWVSADEFFVELSQRPENFTPWFRLIVNELPNMHLTNYGKGLEPWTRPQSATRSVSEETTLIRVHGRP